MKSITIIGGGLAGLTLGIGLRQRGVPVTVIEAGRYPRHRVCGEFISGAGVQTLEQSGLLAELPAHEIRRAQHAAFFAGDRTLGVRPLPSPAVCVSRFILDAALSSRFQKLGGELRENERWRGETAGEGIVCASGRRAHPVERGWRWFGLKVHARGVSLDADLEMHLGRNAYVGLCRLADGTVNVCGLFRRRVNGGGGGATLEWLRGEPGSQLFQRLERAEFESESFCAVAGLSLRSQPVEPRECRVGDALTMIPPITGNGMSMAFESAQLALTPLVSYARGDFEWPVVTQQIAAEQEKQFSSRLRWAGLFHRAIFSPLGTSAMRLLFNSEHGWRAAFAWTR